MANFAIQINRTATDHDFHHTAVHGDIYPLHDIFQEIFRPFTAMAHRQAL